MLPEIQLICAGNGRCSALAFTQDGLLLACAFYEGGIVIVDTKTWRKVSRIKEAKHVIAMDWCPSGPLLACLTREGDITVYVPLERKIGAEFHAHDKAGRTLKWMQNTKYFGETLLISGGNDGYMKLWDAVEGNNIKTVSYKEDVIAIHPSPDGKAMVVALALGKNGVSAWNFEAGEAPVEFGGNIGESWRQIWSPCGNMYLCGGGNNLPGCQIWNKSGELVSGFPSAEPVTVAAWSPGGEKIMYCCGKWIYIASVSTGEVLFSHEYIPTLALNPEYAEAMMNNISLSRAWWKGSELAAVAYGEEFCPEILTINCNNWEAHSVPFPNGLWTVGISPHGEVVLGDEGGAVSRFLEQAEIALLAMGPVDVQAGCGNGRFMPIGDAILVQTLLIAKEKGWRWFSKEPRGQQMLVEQNYDESQAQMLMLEMEEPNLAIISKGMMKGIYLYDYGKDACFRWVPDSGAAPLDVYTEMTFDAAVSYSSEDLVDVEKIKSRLEAYGLNIFWIDVRSDPKDSLWQTRYMSGVFYSYYFIPIITADYFKRFGSAVEYVECTEMLSHHWDISFLNPMISLQMAETDILEKAFADAKIVDIKLDDENKDLNAIARQLPQLFGFSGLNDIDRLGRVLRSCAANSRAKTIVDWEFLHVLAEKIEWYHLHETEKGIPLVDLLVRRVSGEGYDRFFLYPNVIRFMNSQKPVTDSAAKFEGQESLDIIIQHLRPSNIT